MGHKFLAAWFLRPPSLHFKHATERKKLLPSALRSIGTQRGNSKTAKPDRIRGRRGHFVYAVFWHTTKPDQACLCDFQLPVLEVTRFPKCQNRLHIHKSRAYAAEQLRDSCLHSASTLQSGQQVQEHERRLAHPNTSFKLTQHLPDMAPSSLLSWPCVQRTPTRKVKLTYGLSSISPAAQGPDLPSNLTQGPGRKGFSGCQQAFG